jgi:hypothetical protein
MKNVVFMPIIIPEDPKLSKFGGWEWMDYSKQGIKTYLMVMI